MNDFNQLDGLTVFTKVEQKRKRLEDIFDPTTFVLNKEAEQLQQEIAELQKQCPHIYVDGVCKYCGKEEEK